MAQTLYLAKANDDVISHCRCAPREALITWPPQMDCPWCGCGWLFVCMSCNKAFTFATGVLVNESLPELGERDLRRMRRRDPTEDQVLEWAEAMQIFLKGVEVGRTYVYLDGCCLSMDSEAVAFEGWAARQSLPHLPDRGDRRPGDS